VKLQGFALLRVWTPHRTSREIGLDPSEGPLMPGENTEEAPTSSSTWDWGQQRLTVGRHFIRDMEGLWSDVLKLAAVVEDSLDRSIHALCDGRPDRAEEVRLQKPSFDRWEVQIERECVRVLALHQPVAATSLPGNKAHLPFAALPPW